LAIGIACCILIYLFVKHEWSYDGFHEKSDRIYRVLIHERAPDGSIGFRVLQLPSLANAMTQAFPGIRQATRIIRGRVTIIHENKPFYETLFEADSSLFRMFTFPLVAGDPMTALHDPGSMGISEDIAQKYLGITQGGYQKALGKRLSIKRNNTEYLFTISGIMQNIPDNSSLQMDFVISFENFENGKLRIGSNDWGSKNSLYIELM
jgi:putative ABC transport system permease protein